MSLNYDRYLMQHRENVRKAFDWFVDNLPEVTANVLSWGPCIHHDDSKYDKDEYDAYDNYFYGNNKSYKVKQEFNRAWLHHIHNNPHHWQHWVLVNDDPSEGNVALEMDYRYVIEMICDWWSFSHKTGNLYEIFDWYDSHKERMILHDNTRKHVETILSKIKIKLDSMN